MIIDTFKNMTPHPITIGYITIQPEPETLRVDLEYNLIGTILWVNFFECEKKQVEEEPPRIDWTIYIVSNITASAYPHRDDFFIPQINGAKCTWLILNPYFEVKKFRTEEEYAEIFKYNESMKEKLINEMNQWDFTNVCQNEWIQHCLNCWNEFKKTKTRIKFCSKRCENEFKKKRNFESVDDFDTKFFDWVEYVTRKDLKMLDDYNKFLLFIEKRPTNAIWVEKSVVEEYFEKNKNVKS